jgi:hypothetical protein
LSKAARVSVESTPKFERFVLTTKNYVSQYNGMYLARLAEMRGMLKSVAERKWGSSFQVLPNIIDIESEHNGTHSECILIGTLYKDMKLRGSVK